MAKMAGMEQTMTTVTYPMLRINVLAGLASLADQAMQFRVWVERCEPEPGKCPSFGDVLHALYDDTCVGDDVDGSIGDVLYDQEEAHALKEVTSQIDSFLDKYGPTFSDGQCLATPEWPNIVAASVSCLQLFEENDRRYITNYSA